MIRRLFTIGAYGHSRETFMRGLEGNGVDALIDIRQRRGVRGRKYSFVNATALQDELAAHNIGYVYVKELAPTSAIRDLQKKADALSATAKRKRQFLSDEFKTSYKDQVLGTCDISALLLKLERFESPCLFCVEGAPGACHRSLVADWLSLKLNVLVVDIGGGVIS